MQSWSFISDAFIEITLFKVSKTHNLLLFIYFFFLGGGGYIYSASGKYLPSTYVDAIENETVP